MSYCSGSQNMPDSTEKRGCFTEEHLKHEEFINTLKLSYIQKETAQFLLRHRGYSPQDIEANKEFLVSLDNESFNVSADLIIKVEGKRFIFLKCVANSLDSWERYSIAFCRVVDSHQIPYALITDGKAATLLNTIDGVATEGDVRIMPHKNEAEKIISKTAFTSYPEDRKGREKRIIYAFEAINSTPKTNI